MQTKYSSGLLLRFFSTLLGLGLFLVSLQFLLLPVPAISGEINPQVGTSMYVSLLIKVFGFIFATFAVVNVYHGVTANTYERLVRAKSGIAATMKNFFILGVPILIILYVAWHANALANLLSG